MGQVEKMQIQAFSDATESRRPLSAPYKFQVNPSTYSEKFTIEYSEERAAGAGGAELRYYGATPNEWEFEILIDGTGVVKEASALNISLIGNVQAIDVQEEVNKLKAATIDIVDSTHKNPYLIVAWGNRDIFKGSLSSLDLNYKLFKPDGSPLRVIAKLHLKAWVSDEERIRAEGLQSPDITHERTYKGHDRLSYMSHQIYNKNDRYIDVAKANRLNSFRKIPEGTTIKFPPIK